MPESAAYFAVSGRREDTESCLNAALEDNARFPFIWSNGLSQEAAALSSNVPRDPQFGQQITLGPVESTVFGPVQSVVTGPSGDVCGVDSESFAASKKSLCPQNDGLGEQAALVVKQKLYIRLTEAACMPDPNDRGSFMELFSTKYL